MKDSHKKAATLSAALAGAIALGLASGVGTIDNSGYGLELTPAMVEVLDRFELVQLPDGQGGSLDTLRLSGLNVRLETPQRIRASIGIGLLPDGFADAMQELFDAK